MFPINIEITLPLNVVHEDPDGGLWVVGGGRLIHLLQAPRPRARLPPTKTAIDLHMRHSIYYQLEPPKYYQHRNI